jgi:hypothetical protein
MRISTGDKVHDLAREKGAKKCIALDLGRSDVSHRGISRTSTSQIMMRWIVLPRQGSSGVWWADELRVLRKSLFQEERSVIGNLGIVKTVFTQSSQNKNGLQNRRILRQRNWMRGKSFSIEKGDLMNQIGNVWPSPEIHILAIAHSPSRSLCIG